MKPLILQRLQEQGEGVLQLLPQMDLRVIFFLQTPACTWLHPPFRPVWPGRCKLAGFALCFPLGRGRFWRGWQIPAMAGSAGSWDVSLNVAWLVAPSPSTHVL